MRPSAEQRRDDEHRLLPHARHAARRHRVGEDRAARKQPVRDDAGAVAERGSGGRPGPEREQREEAAMSTASAPTLAMR